MCHDKSRPPFSAKISALRYTHLLSGRQEVQLEVQLASAKAHSAYMPYVTPIGGSSFKQSAPAISLLQLSSINVQSRHQVAVQSVIDRSIVLMIGMRGPVRSSQYNMYMSTSLRAPRHVLLLYRPVGNVELLAQTRQRCWAGPLWHNASNKPYTILAPRPLSSARLFQQYIPCRIEVALAVPLDSREAVPTTPKNR